MMPLRTPAKKTAPKIEHIETETPAETPAETPVETPVETKETAEVIDPWTALAEEAPKEREFVAGSGTARIDVEKETPAVIKKWLTDSHTLYVDGLAALPEDASVSKRNDVIRKAWKTFTFATPELADEFERLALRYAQKRDERWTLKTRRDAEVPARVDWLAKPFEARHQPAAPVTVPVTPATGEASVPEVAGTP